MNKPALLLLLAATAALTVVLAASPASTPEPVTPEAPATAEIPPAAGAAVSSLAVAMDPATGRLMPATAEQLADLLSEDMRKALSTSGADLFEEASPTPGGGVMIDLQGRFQSAQWARRAADGSLQVQCESGEPESRQPTAPSEER